MSTPFFTGVLEQLNIDSSSIIAIGTLRLDTIVRPSNIEEPPTASTSTSQSSPWKTYTPSLIQDLADIGLATRKKLSQASKGVQSSTSGRGAPTSPRSSILKRKRSTSTTTSSYAPTASEDSTHLKVLPPTLHEIDHLVKNAFIAVEYILLEASTAVKQEEHHQGDNESSPPRITSCLFRIYAIPLDAPGLNSKIDALQLKIRSKATKALAQKTFGKLLYHLHLDVDEWTSGSVSSDTPPKYLMTRNSVSLPILNNSSIIHRS